MTGATSSWIPRSRIRLALGLAAACAVAGGIGALWSPLMLVLLVPALGAGWAGFVMLSILDQLSPGGGGWQGRIHQLVVSRLGLSREARPSVLDIGCGDASLLAALLDQAPDISATGVDFWGSDWDYAQAACEARLARLGHTATFRRMDAARLEFPDDHFDMVVSVMCFHEVRAPAGAALRGPLLALAEALRVLRPGGAFVIIDRFADPADYGDPAALAQVLKSATEVRRDALVAALGLPWPLRSKRALGPAEMISGRKAAP